MIVSLSEPVLAQRIKNASGIAGTAYTAIITCQTTNEVAVFPVQIVAQYSAAKTQIGTNAEEVVIAGMNLLQPEWHDLHQPLGTGL